jgi:hypothetical protein
MTPEPFAEEVRERRSWQATLRSRRSWKGFREASAFGSIMLLGGALVSALIVWRFYHP